MKNVQFSVLGKARLRELAEFVVQENFSHHNENLYNDRNLMQKEIKHVLNEEMNFSDSRIIAATRNNKIIGSIRTLKWNTKDLLPVEKMFSVDLRNFFDPDEYNIWHIGRFAIKKDCTEGGINLFKTLMTFAIQHVCSDEKALAIAECDVKLLKILRILGIKAYTISDPVHYLGSETVPIILERKSLKNFLKKNLHLIAEPEKYNLHQSVVITNSTQNYTFV